ncbi:hypothetical protein Q8A73_018136 [Channa argus]|nr:hypothetical protein Q8A73_018136 [Channa argus]
MKAIRKQEERRVERLGGRDRREEIDAQEDAEEDSGDGEKDEAGGRDAERKKRDRKLKKKEVMNERVRHPERGGQREEGETEEKGRKKKNEEEGGCNEVNLTERVNNDNEAKRNRGIKGSSKNGRNMEIWSGRTLGLHVILQPRSNLITSPARCRRGQISE